MIKDLLASEVVSSKIDLRNINKTLEAFKGIEGRNYYPQIYIPALSKRQNQFARTAATLNAGSHIQEHVLYDGNESVSSYPAYYSSTDGAFVENGNSVDETYAVENDVWVISLNETVDDDGIYFPSDPGVTNNNGIATIPPPPADPTRINVEIDSIGINCLKESWAAGKSDVSIRATRMAWNGNHDGQANGADYEYSSDRSSGDMRGTLIRQFDRTETWNGTLLQMKNVNYNLQANWQIGNWFFHPVVYLYVIFERDNWPAKIRTNSVYPFFAHDAADYRLMNYRSSDDCFLASSFYASKTGWPANI